MWFGIMTFAIYIRKLENKPEKPCDNPLEEFLKDIDWVYYEINFLFLRNYIEDVGSYEANYDRMFVWDDFSERIHEDSSGNILVDYGSSYGLTFKQLPETERLVLEYLYENYCR